MLVTILIVVLLLVLLGAIPGGPIAHNFGYGPSGLVGVVLVVILILALLGRL